MADLKLIKKQAQKELEKAENLNELKEIFNKYLGNKGEITEILHSLAKMPKARRIKVGEEANVIKKMIREQFIEKSEELRNKINQEAEKKEWIDISAPAKKPKSGHLHPLTLVSRKIEEIFQHMGFSIIEGPEIETEWYSFDALNMPKDHPARDMWDTFWLKSPIDKKLVLRPHTSPGQVRYMEKNNPPLRIIVPGKVFRHEATDARHEMVFYQVEGLMVDKRGKISAANFKAVIEEFLRRFFGQSVEIRLRPGFFPFTEPSFEIDMSCLVCSGKGCPVCKNCGWVEIMGAGMVHPDVFKNSGLNPKDYQGFAFGLGLDRFAMMKYKIDDIRLLHGGDLRFLEQF